MSDATPDKELYDLYVEYIWSRVPDYYQDKIGACESTILAGIETIISIMNQRADHRRFGIDPKSISFPQCTCRMVDGKHHPNCPGSEEYWKTKGYL